jgi:hypothetical protein
MKLQGLELRAATAVAMILSVYLAPLPAAAQIGSGWTEYEPAKRLQLRGCGEHRDGEVETFRLTCDDTEGDNRAEQRIEDEYDDGTRQFQGEVRVVSLGGQNISLKQTFMPENGPFLILAVGGNGRLYSVGNGGDLATSIIGRWVRINTIHDVRAGTHEIYVDGQLRFTKREARQVPWHDKYGSYRLRSGRGPVVVEWRNVRYFRDGRSSGGGAPPRPPSPPPGGGGGSGGGAGGSGPPPVEEGELVFEAEALPVSHSGTGTAVHEDAATSGGRWVALEAENAGSWMEFTLPDVPAGSYDLKLGYKTNANRGQLLARLDADQVPAALGDPLDQYAGDSSYEVAILGSVTFPRRGDHTVRLVVAGKNDVSSGFLLSADRFLLDRHRLDVSGEEVAIWTPPPAVQGGLGCSASPAGTGSPSWLLAIAAALVCFWADSRRRAIAGKAARSGGPGPARSAPPARTAPAPRRARRTTRRWPRGR